MITAALMSIGDELALGQIVDTNAAWLAEQLAARSIACVEHITVADERSRIAAAIERLCGDPNVGLLIITGGIGPTVDDLTRDALADAMGEPLVEDPAGIMHLEIWFAGRGSPMPERNRVQALRPESGRLLPNRVGTAPGLAAMHHDTTVFVLPGVPREMMTMFEEQVLPRLDVEEQQVIRTGIVRCFGLGESALAARLGDLMRRDRNPTVGTTASQAIISCRIRAVGDPKWCDRAIEEAAAEIEQRAGVYAFGRDDETLAGAVVRELVRRSETVAVAESCTGGLLGSMITEVAGSSAAFLGGWLTYTNEMKTREIGVPAGHFGSGAAGAVSVEVATDMAQGARRKAGADHALAITGIAGPDGGTEAKPVGTVFIALDSAGHDTQVRRFQFTGDRAGVRDRSAKAALAMLLWRLRGCEDLDMLWQKTNGESVSRPSS
jgi:nicotinamide-nucleotide amidase